MKYRAVLFDLDGTLLNYKLEQQIAVEYTKSLFVLVNSAEVQNFETLGVPSADSPEMKSAFLQAGVHQEPVKFLEDYFNKLSRQGIALPGAVELLESLSGTVRLGLVSNGFGRVQNPRLENSGLSGFFKQRVFSGDIGIAKPDPEILHIAMKELAVSSEETLFIGDSTTTDQPAAEAAELDFFLFKGDFSDPRLLSMLQNDPVPTDTLP